MPWEKGQSGNLAGRPRGTHGAMLARMIRSGTKQGAELVEFAQEVLRGKITVQIVTKDGEVVDIGPSVKDRLDAMKWLADRGWGRTPDATTGDDGEPAVPPELGETELEDGLGPTGVVQ